MTKLEILKIQAGNIGLAGGNIVFFSLYSATIWGKKKKSVWYNKNMKKIKAKTSQIAKGLEWRLSWRWPETLQTDQNVSTTLTVYHGPRGALPDLLWDHNRSLLNLQTGICCTIWHQCTTRSSHLYVLWDNFKIDSHQTYFSNLQKLSKAVTIRTEVITFQFWKSCITYNQSKTMTATKCKKRERNSDHWSISKSHHSNCPIPLCVSQTVYPTPTLPIWFVCFIG